MIGLKKLFELYIIYCTFVCVFFFKKIRGREELGGKERDGSEEQEKEPEFESGQGVKRGRL